MDRQTVVETGIATSLIQTRTAVRSLHCRVVSGSKRGGQIAIAARPVVVGADPEADLMLEDPKVSRRHAELRAVPEGVEVRDLGSTNGVFVNGARISEAVVPLDCSIRCGDTTLKITAAPTPTVKPSGRDRFGGLVGESLSMREVFAVLELASPTDATVLIQGESGTGKELAARAVHDHSERAAQPFVVVDCSAAAEQLIESQLFGHRRGAFTGAVSDRKGAFVEANGGTIFLDELGELPLASQGRLLRALEAKTVQPLGADRPASFDARVVAATNRDLHGMVQDETFRFDLFHRLSVVHLMIPPLRERPEDLAALIRHFYEGRGLEPGPIDGDNLELLEGQALPGNVRELRNTLERALVLSGSSGPPFRDLQIWAGQPSIWPYEVVDTSLPFKAAKDRWIAAFERRYLAAVYTRFGNNVSRAAEHAELTRHHLRDLLERHGLKQ